MSGGGRPDKTPSQPPLNNGGEILLRLLQNDRQKHQQQSNFYHTFSQSSHNNNLSLDPAVAAVGPSIPNPNFIISPNHQTTPFLTAPHHHFNNLFQQQQKEPHLGFALGTPKRNGFDPDSWIDQRRAGTGSAPPPGFAGKPANHTKFNGSSSSSSGSGSGSSRDNGNGFSGQFDLNSMSRLDVVNKSLMNSLGVVVDSETTTRDEFDELNEQLVDFVLGDNDSNASNTKKKHHRDKDFRSDAREKDFLSQRMRNSKKMIECRRDIDTLNANFLAIYKSLIPEEEVKAKQKKLLMSLESLVCKEWPNARLHVYGSCANSFGVSKSDIDICLALDDQDINKAEILLKLADIFQSDNLQNVQALTRARVPIVKLMDPGTGISCDICINNVLAVVNTKLLRDYADIDVRLRQLAFLVKHWAKSRRVNETYHGTLSSYAYVLMCIHFLQTRNPPILPCLQRMKPTHSVTIDGIHCAFFDQVERLGDFGSRNKESISQLLWSFFRYWAYCHDYANSVISIRTGAFLSKHEKDWTRRVGNDRHLICIEDPFETSHDLGRVVDKHSIRVLRYEFERAAWIMQSDPNPCVALFDPYDPDEIF